MYENLPFPSEVRASHCIHIKNVLRLDAYCFSLNNKRVISMRIEFKDQWRVERSREYCIDRDPNLKLLQRSIFQLIGLNNERCNWDHQQWRRFILISPIELGL